MALRIELLGRVRVRAGTAEIEGTSFPGRQGRAVFGYLASERRPVSREELADAIWPDSLPRSWERDLSAVVSKLRTLLAGVSFDVEIVGGSGTYQLRLPAEAQVDVEEATSALAVAEQALAQGSPAEAAGPAGRAVALASQELLPGLRGLWVEDRREALRRLRARALDVRADALRASGDLAAAREAAAAVISSDPYREAGYVRLIRLELQAGNRALALQTYERCRSLLAEELGVEPGPGLEAAYADALQLDAGPPPMVRVPPLAVVDSNAFVGRVDELAWLEHQFQAVAEGGTRVAVLVGEAGIGKTRLATELARSAAGRAVVLAGRCDEEAGVPYRPFVEALRPLVDEGSFTAEVEPARRLFPDLATEAAASSEDPQVARFVLFEAVVALIRAVGRRRPVVLLIDDLQAADRASSLLLRHIGRASRPARLMVVVTCRAGSELPDGAREVLADLDHDGRLARLDLDGLDANEVAELLEVDPPPGAHRQDLATAVHAATGGNPFFVGELSSHLRTVGPDVLADELSGAELLRTAGVPRGIEEAIARNLARASDDTRRVLIAGSAIGEELDIDLVGTVAGLDDDTVLSALDTDVARQVVVSVPGVPGRYRFTHGLVREALYASVPAPRRLGLHRAVADAIESHYRDDLDRHLGALAHHLSLAAAPGRVGRVVEYAERAGARALAQLAYHEAAALYERALELLDLRPSAARATRCRLLLALADASNRAGAVDVARHALVEAADQARASGSPAYLAEAALATGALLVDDGLEGGAVSTSLVELLEEALAALPPGDDALTARLLARLAQELHFSDQERRRRDLVDRAEAMARRVAEPLAVARALTARCYELLASPDTAEKARVIDELTALSGTREEPLQWRLRHHLERGELVEAEPLVQRLATAAERSGVASARWYPKVWAAMRALLVGPLDDVEPRAGEALELGQQGRGQAATLAVASAQLFGLRLLQGRLHELEPAIKTYAETAPHRPVWKAALGYAQAEAGRLEQARCTFEELAARRFEDLPRSVDWAASLTLLAWTCGRLGDSERAALLYELMAPHAELFVVVGVAPAVCTGSFHHPLGVLAATAGHREQAAVHLEGAIERDERIGARPWAALARLDHARLLCSSGRAADVERGGLLLSAVARAGKDFGLTGLEQRPGAFGRSPPSG